MLNGGEKAKIKNIVMAIKGEYPKILDVLGNKDYMKDQNSINQLFDSNKKIFMWLAHLSTTFINSNQVVNSGFDTMQEANRFSSISVRDSKRVQLLVDSIEVIPEIQKELIKQVDTDNNQRERVLKDIMYELGIEDPNKKKKNSKIFLKKCRKLQTSVI